MSVDQGRFLEPEFISRDEALERFMTPLPVREQNRSVRWQNEKIHKLGASGDTIVFRPSVPYMNHQLREQYDIDHFLRIGREIAQFGQLQDCGTALFTGRVALEAYIAESNEFYGTSLSPSEIPEHRLGGRLVTIYGHNRQLGAAAINLSMNGHPDRGIALRGRLHVDPSFRDFLRMQAIENTGQSPPAWSRARSIARYLELSMRDGTPPTFSELAEYYGVHEDQIWRALSYVQLPAEVKKLVETDQLPYSGAIELKRLFGLYAEQDIISLAHRFASEGIRGEKIEQEVAKRVVVKGLPPEVQAFVETKDITTKQAELLREMYDYGASDDELNNLVVWIVSRRPLMTEIREHVSKWRRKVRTGQLSAFDQLLEGEELKEEKRRVAASTTAMHIGSAVSEVTRQIDALKSLIDNGQLGPAAGNKPVARELQRLNGYFEGALSELNGSVFVHSSEIRELERLLVNVSGKLDPGLHELQDSIARISISLLDLLETEAATSAEDQERRLTDIRDRISRIEPPSTPVSLF